MLEYPTPDEPHVTPAEAGAVEEDPVLDLAVQSLLRAFPGSFKVVDGTGEHGVSLDDHSAEL